LLALFAAGCMSTKVALHPKFDPGAKPSYTDYFDYYWFSLAGKPTVNLAQVCLDQKPLGFQRVKAADDIIISVVTLGIYTPATVKVWCGEY
jgi:hypothetical protein